MRYLLDTVAFLWWIAGEDSLSPAANEVIHSEANELYLSAASAWEIAIKARLGRLSLAEDPARLIPEQMSANSIQALPIQISHALHVHDLPDLHRDPVDRLIVAQSRLEDLPVVTPDDRIAQYGVQAVW